MKQTIIIALGLLLAGCAAQQEELRAQNARDKILWDKISQAKRASMVVCADKPSCDKAFALTKIYVQQHADMKVQLSDDTLISTYNPIRSGTIGINASKAPSTGQGSVIQITVACRGSEMSYLLNICGPLMVAIYDGFKPYVESRLQ